MRNNLTKKEVLTAPAFELAVRFNYLLDKTETMPLEQITVADAREILWIEDQLRVKLAKAIGKDIYPPDNIKEEAPSNYMISLLKSRRIKAEPKEENKLSFKVVIISSIGSKVATQTVRAESKTKADIIAQEMIRKLGLKKARHEIS